MQRSMLSDLTLDIGLTTVSRFLENVEFPFKTVSS